MSEDKEYKAEYVICPFCKEGDFDLQGLKYHFLMGYCVQFEETEEIGWRREAPIPPEEPTT